MEYYSGYVEVVDNPETTRPTSTARIEDRKVSDTRRKAEAEKLKKEGNDYFLKGQYVRAVEKYSESAKVYGTRPVVMCNLAAAYLKLNQYELAEWAADSALFHSPKMAKARYRRAMARKGRGMFRGAELDLRVVIKHHPEITEANVELLKIQEERRLHGNGQRPYENYDEDFPPHEAEDWDPPLDSDSEDVRHSGNGRPCKFYNHGGCRRGSLCDFSHAPDSNSVRDELGQNICIYFLLEDCKYGTKCNYAHTKDNLPRGWWSTPKGMKDAKELRSVVKDPAGKADLIARLENTTAYGRLERVQRDLSNVEANNAMLPELLKRRAEQMGQKGVKAGATSKDSAASSSRSVLIMCLSNPEVFTDINGDLLKALREKAKLLHAENATQALAYLSEPDLVGVIIGDEGITNRPNSKVVARLVHFTEQGGAVVVGGLFPSFCDGNGFERLFKHAFKLPWERGAYFRTTFHKNTRNDIVKSNPSLSASYSMKALHLQKIPPESALYKADESSFTQSLVFAPEAITNFDESPAVSVQFGRGMISYLGDVNAEKESTKTILAMLGLLDSPLPKPPVLPSVEKDKDRQPTEGARKASNKKKRKQKTKKTKSGIAAAVPPTPLTGPLLPSQSTPMPTKPHHEPFIMHLCLDDGESMAWSYKHSIAAIETKICVRRATTEAQAWNLSSSTSLTGIFVTDSALTDLRYKVLLDKLVSYVDEGGRVVFGGAFSGFVQFPQFEALFSKFHLPWKAASYTRDSVRLSGDWDYEADKYAFLPKEISLKAVFLSGVSPGDEVYRPAYDATTPASQTPIAVSYSDRGGCVGYIGDVNAEPCTTPTILALFDLLKYPRSLTRPSTNKFVIVLTFPGTFEEYKETPLVSRMKAEGIEIISNADLSDSRLADLLSSSGLQSVFLLDDLCSTQESAWLVHKVAAYVWSGGTVILAGDFCYLPPDEFEDFMTDNFYLPWKISSATELSVSANPGSSIFRKLPDVVEEHDEMYSDGSFLYDVGSDEIVYGSEPGLGPEEATHVPVAYAAVGKGHVAYFGHDEIGEVDEKLILAIVKSRS